MRKVLVCGSTGFIGRNLAERLAERSDIAVFGTYHRRPPLEDPRIRSVRADLADPRDVARALKGMDVVIQAAATTSGARDIVQRPWIHVKDNAVMNSHIFQTACEYEVSQVLFFSCTVMYPSSAKPLKEEDFDPGRGLFPKYFGVGWTKVYLEKMCEFYSRIGKTKFMAIRHSNIYGPHDKFDPERSHVFGATLTKVLTHRGGAVTVWGSGAEKRDLLYVEDLADFVERAMEKQPAPFDLVNVGCGQAVSITDLVREIIRISGKPLSIEHDLSAPSLPVDICLDISRARAVYGWRPTHSLEEGIRKTIAWYRQHVLPATASAAGDPPASPPGLKSAA